VNGKKRQIVETDLAQHNNINYYLHTCSLEEPWPGIKSAIRWRQDPKRPRWTQEPCTRVPWRLHDTTQMHAAIARRPGSPTHHSTPPRQGSVQYTANETGACLGGIVDSPSARPCLVGVTIGNLLRAREGQRASNETGSIKQGCSTALGLGMQARCASMQAAACGPSRPTQIYKPADEGNASYRDLAVPGPPLGELRACEIQ
jgi:hypothetical protein